MKPEDVKPLDVTIPGLGQVFLYFVDPLDEKEYIENSHIALEVDSFLRLSEIVRDLTQTEGPQSILIEPYGSTIGIVPPTMIEDTKQMIAEFKNEMDSLFGSDILVKKNYTD